MSAITDRIFAKRDAESAKDYQRRNAALEAVLLFFSAGDWNAADETGQTKANAWQVRICLATEDRMKAQSGEARTKVLCDMIRDVLRTT